MRSLTSGSSPPLICTVISSSASTLPLPLHLLQGVSTVDPSPLQVLHTDWTWMKPMAVSITSPVPLQVGQVRRFVPGSAPSPLQGLQVSFLRTRIVLEQPFAASMKERSICTCTSFPAPLLLEFFLPPNMPLSSSKMSMGSPPKFWNPWKPSKPPNPPAAFPFASMPPISYILLFCSSERISYALLSSENFSCALGSSLFTSGCSFFAFWKYAFLISCDEADLGTPSTSYKSFANTGELERKNLFP
mmetsp:Transcript_42479/g.133798  ORF Transcript_42479/g.133798 Transcript_42479/m.133798 type:complete len:246 (+) Transcript_42479:499-1236(+)